MTKAVGQRLGENFHAMKPEIALPTKTCHRSRTFLNERKWGNKPSACLLGKLRIILSCRLGRFLWSLYEMSSLYVWKHQLTFRYFPTRNEPSHCCWSDCVLWQFIKGIVLPCYIWALETKISWIYTPYPVTLANEVVFSRFTDTVFVGKS